MFEEYALPGFVLESLEELEIREPSAIQQMVIPKALEGADILGGSPTGTGKTAAFLLPIIARLAQRPRRNVQCLVIEPTRELALQVVTMAEQLLKFQDESIEAGDGEIQERIQVAAVIGGGDRKLQQQQLEQATIICATPGRLLEYLKKEWFDPRSVEILVIDEADRMLDMGFRDDVAAVTRALDRRYQTMLFSATLEGFGVRDFARNVLNEPCEVNLSDSTGEKLPELLQLRAYLVTTEESRVKALTHLLTTARGRSIVFVRTKDNLGRLAAQLKRQGMSFASLTGDSSQQERTAALRRFSDKEVSLLLATDVASRGLDIENVEYVYNYDLPRQGEVFIHRAGRTARAGAKGVVFSLVGADEIGLLAKIERYTQHSIERRVISGITLDFAQGEERSEKKRSRALAHGGFGRKQAKDKDEKKPHKKVRLRDKKNKGKPDFAAKRAQKAARLAQKADAAAVGTASAGTAAACAAAGSAASGNGSKA